MFFTGKIPFLPWVKQSVQNVIHHGDCVENIYAGSHGFYEVVLQSLELRDQLLEGYQFFIGQVLYMW